MLENICPPSWRCLTGLALQEREFSTLSVISLEEFRENEFGNVEVGDDYLKSVGIVIVGDNVQAASVVIGKNIKAEDKVSKLLCLGEIEVVKILSKVLKGPSLVVVQMIVRFLLKFYMTKITNRNQ